MLKVEIDTDCIKYIEMKGKTADILTELSFVVQIVMEHLACDKEVKRKAVDAIAIIVKKELGLENTDRVVENFRRADIGDILKGI